MEQTSQKCPSIRLHQRQTRYPLHSTQRYEMEFILCRHEMHQSFNSDKKQWIEWWYIQTFQSYPADQSRKRIYFWICKNYGSFHPSVGCTEKRRKDEYRLRPTNNQSLKKNNEEVFQWEYHYPLQASGWCCFEWHWENILNTWCKITSLKLLQCRTQILN